MKTLTVSDLHGKPYWSYVNDDTIHLYDLVIFLGDYVDSFDVPNIEMLQNLNLLVEFKKRHPEKVILLWGNHDVQYFFDSEMHRCSGFRPEMKTDFQYIFYFNRNLFQLAHQIDNYLWSHAGVHVGWYNFRFDNQKYPIKNGEKDTRFELPKEGNLAERLNLAFELGHEYLFDCGWYRGGIHKMGGPLWCDKKELYTKPLFGYHQIVGHTQLNDIKTYKNYKGDNTSVTFTDCLDNCSDLLTLNI